MGEKLRVRCPRETKSRVLPTLTRRRPRAGLLLLLLPSLKSLIRSALSVHRGQGKPTGKVLNAGTLWGGEGRGNVV